MEGSVVKKILLTSVVSFVVALGVSGQESKSLDELKRQAKKNSQSVKYDKFDDFTRIRGDIYDMITLKETLSNAFINDNGIRALNFTTVIVFPGDTLTETNGIYLIIFGSQSERFKFTRNARLTFLFDGQRLRYEPIEKDWDVDGLVGEKLVFRVTREELEMLANAKKLEMKLGDFEKKMNERHQKVMRQTLTMGDMKMRPPEKK